CEVDFMPPPWESCAPTQSPLSHSSVCYFMGMCSRQERIQKDVDIVIQKCKAEKDCLFFGEFPLSLLIKRHLLVFVFSDNTYVSNSENNDEVLVTRDPIPVIFHRIATGKNRYYLIIKELRLKKTNESEEDSEGDNDSEEFYYVGQVNYDGELHKHPQLEADLAAVRDLYGHHAVSLRSCTSVIAQLLSAFLNSCCLINVLCLCKLRSPSYPPPGCVKSKKKLKPEKDGMSKSHRLLRRTCSGTVKPEMDGCVGKSHKLLGHSLSSDPRMEQHQPLKQPHRLLSRPCSTAVKPEDCPPLRPHKLSPRSSVAEPRCEHAAGSSDGGALKPHRLLGRSCSGSVRTEELDGLKHHHRLLSRSYSSSTKMGKSDIFKEHVTESRRLSLTSGLIGILAPSLSSTPQTMEYAEQRIPVLNEFCVVCDEPHVFQNGPMLRPTVCERELCVFAFQTLGVMNEAADEIATGAQVVDLLVSMCRSALESPRKVVIFEPYPSVVDPNDSQALAFNPRKKDYDRVMRALDSIASFREMTQAPYLEIKKQMDKHDPLAHPMLQWVISSNRSHIVKLPVTRQLKFMHTPHQFLLLSSPPAKESNFRAAKVLFGSTFAFHGSHIENWHSILRNGLVVASNTRLQLHGAIYGSGIYLSPLSSISFGYSGMNKKQQKVASKDETAANKSNINLQSQKKGQNPQFLQSRNLKCIALCEVITSPDLHKHGDIWVVPNTDHVCTRFFFVYEDGQVGDTSINAQDPGIHREILRVIGNQTATG
uniref:Poly [ADP-ribose] polymerase n=1 Tax=Sinocyclocheilus anshuiensis TaxID=1608454 RepID=A0A671RY09_9TELE